MRTTHTTLPAASAPLRTSAPATYPRKRGRPPAVAAAAAGSGVASDADSRALLSHDDAAHACVRLVAACSHLSLTARGLGVIPPGPLSHPADEHLSEHHFSEHQLSEHQLPEEQVSEAQVSEEQTPGQCLTELLSALAEGAVGPSGGQWVLDDGDSDEDGDGASVAVTAQRLRLLWMDANSGLTESLLVRVPACLPFCMSLF